MPAFAPATIAELSALSGVDVEVIRHYLAFGLIPQPRRRRGHAGELAFHREHLDRLRFITRSVALGFSLDAIAELLGIDGSYRTCGDIYVVANRTLDAIRVLDIAPSPSLERLVAACPRRGRAADCPILAELARPD